MRGGLTSIDFHRLRWFVKKNISLYDSITVTEDATDSKSAQEPYSTSHPISKVALTYPPVSAITISVDTLDEYINDWGYEHGKHAVPEGSPYHSGERFDAEGEVVHCCGHDQPGPGPALEIVAEPGAFVTIGQFVETVHAWLVEIDSQLRWALNMYSYCEPLDPTIDLYIRPGSLTPLRVLKAGGRTPENWDFTWAQVAKMASNGISRRKQAELQSQ